MLSSGRSQAFACSHGAGVMSCFHVGSQVAKWTGDFFNRGIYDLHIQLRGVPLLEWETDVQMDRSAASC